MEALDLPEEPGRLEHAEGGRGRSRPREMPAPDERERVYEAVRAHVSPEMQDQTEVGQQPDRNDGRSYWDQVPRLLEMRRDYQERWPADQQPVADCSADPPGSYRSHGGFYLKPDRHAEAVAPIGRGSQNGATISADIGAAERENNQSG